MFGCENRTTVPIEVTFDISRLPGCLRSTQQAIVKKVIEPNRVEFLMNIRKDQINQPALRLDAISFKYKELE